MENSFYHYIWFNNLDEAKENKHEQDEVAETEKPHGWLFDLLAQLMNFLEENPEAVRESIGEDAANAGQAIGLRRFLILPFLI